MEYARRVLTALVMFLKNRLLFQLKNETFDLGLEIRYHKWGAEQGTCTQLGDQAAGGLQGLIDAEVVRHRLRLHLPDHRLPRHTRTIQHHGRHAHLLRRHPLRLQEDRRQPPRRPLDQEAVPRELLR